MDSDSDWSDNVEGGGGGGREGRGQEGQKANHHLVSNPGEKVVSDPVSTHLYFIVLFPRLCYMERFLI